MPSLLLARIRFITSAHGTVDVSSSIKKLTEGGGERGYEANYGFGSRTPRKTLGSDALRTLSADVYYAKGTAVADVAAHNILSYCKRQEPPIPVTVISEPEGTATGNDRITYTDCDVVSDPNLDFEAGSGARAVVNYMLVATEKQTVTI